MKRLDLLLFGASGFTGKATIPALIQHTRCHGRNLTWGIAGRSRSKLEQVLNNCAKTAAVDLSHIPIIEADVNDSESLNAMAAQSKLIINVCGPFRFYGEPVVKACIANGTHHLDVSGEPLFIETMELKYKRAAEENRCYVISACGFDSIPCDLGLVFLQENFPGRLNAVEAYLKLSASSANNKGPIVNYATWESLIHGMKDYSSLLSVRKQLKKDDRNIDQKHSTSRPKGKTVFKNSLTGQWSLPFPGADASIVKRSQKYFYEKNGQQPLAFNMYFCVNSFSSVLSSIFAYVAITILVKSEFGTNLLLKHPKLFSSGLIDKTPPTAKMGTELFLKGSGQVNTNSKNAKGGEQNIVGRISAPDAAYGSTGTIIVLSAITLLEEYDKLPNFGNGGVFTPAAAFSETTLINRLNENGITFKILANL